MKKRGGEKRENDNTKMHSHDMQQSWWVEQSISKVRGEKTGKFYNEEDDCYCIASSCGVLPWLLVSPLYKMLLDLRRCVYTATHAFEG